MANKDYARGFSVGIQATSDQAVAAGSFGDDWTRRMESLVTRTIHWHGQQQEQKVRAWCAATGLPPEAGELVSYRDEDLLNGHCTCYVRRLGTGTEIEEPDS